MTSHHSSEVLVFPDDCDGFGHVSSSSFLRLFERARWGAIAGGPGMEVFERLAARPVVRKATLDYYELAHRGDVLTIDTALTHQGETSFTLHQTARRAAGGVMLAEGDFLIVCLDADGGPAKVPPEIARFFGTRPSVRPGETQHIAVRGLATAVDIQGDGPAILFIHGFPLDRTQWRHLIATLSGWRRIAPDLRGMGLSDVPDEEYSIPRYAEDMVGLLDTLHIDNAVVCGLSMGGYIALDMFREHRDRVRALVLVNTRAEADDAAGRKARDTLIDLVGREGPGAVADLMVPKLLGKSSLAAMPRVVEHLRTMITNTPEKGLVGALEAMRDREDASALLETIDVPTLVVTGRDDQLVPVAKARALAKAIPGALFTQIPEAGHLTPLEQPIATSRVIREFVDALD